MLVIPNPLRGQDVRRNHDWNVYCLVDASFPIISTSIVANLSKDTISRTKAESVTVTGQIKPGIANALITVTFVKPDGTTVDRAVTANEKGAFTVSYTPDTVGNWTITAWYSGAESPSHAYTPRLQRGLTTGSSWHNGATATRRRRTQGIRLRRRYNSSHSDNRYSRIRLHEGPQKIVTASPFLFLKTRVQNVNGDKQCF